MTDEERIIACRRRAVNLCRSTNMGDEYLTHIYSMKLLSTAATLFAVADGLEKHSDGMHK
jgi:hypothetical protein